MNNAIQFPDGSSVEWVDKETLRYSDSDHSVFVWVDFEPRFFSKKRVIKASSIQRWKSYPPTESAEISDEKKAQVIEKVKKYYEKYRVKCRVES